MAQDKAYSPLPITFEMVRGYVAIPPGEALDASKYKWGWEQPDYDDSNWQAAVSGPPAAARDSVDSPSRWFLVPREIPFMEESPIRLSRVRLRRTFRSLPASSRAGRRCGFPPTGGRNCSSTRII